MVHLQRSLLFPNLNFQSEAQFKSWSPDGPDFKRASNSGKTTSIFKLDWGAVDKIKEDRWLKDIAKTSDSKFPGTLPQKYDSWVKGMLFALPENYLSEIRRCARLAQTEWGTGRGFDTMIREICLQPAVEYAYVAFRLMADCLYDASTNYFYRGPDKGIATQALLYKFWSFQTGRGLVRSNSGFDKLDTSYSSDLEIFKKRISLMSINCDKCGEKAFLEASSDGWKVNMSDIEVICSCGNKVIGMAPTAPAPAHPSYPLNDDSSKYQAREFMKAIEGYEKDTEKTIVIRPADPSLYVDAPVAEIKLRNSHDAVISDLKKKGYVVYDNNPKSVLNPPQVASEGVIVKATTPITKGSPVIMAEDIPEHEESFTQGVPGSCAALKELVKANKIMTEAMEPRGNGVEKKAENMLFSELKDGLKDLPKEGADKIKVLVNGMPVMEMIGCPAGLSEKDAVHDALQMEKIKRYTRGKELLKTVYVPGYLLSLVFGRPEKKKAGRRK
jgi:hypothetical protein